ncbi:response regulator transcription factor, partial [Streptomyces sp. NPDC059104]|uniref:response regulator transcription factor n=1 Tax=Streptomyces sp. NPDC059104 TaxID=3346729 RepID=UPI0036A695FB
MAARLHLGEGTVKNHISRLPGRLGLRDRTQAALYARDDGLLRAGGPRPRRPWSRETHPCGMRRFILLLLAWALPTRRLPTEETHAPSSTPVRRTIRRTVRGRPRLRAGR